MVDRSSVLARRSEVIAKCAEGNRCSASDQAGGIKQPVFGNSDPSGRSVEHFPLLVAYHIRQDDRTAVPEVIVSTQRHSAGLRWLMFN
jgi:hypothetical protein